jgi:hypothetical protein
MNCVLSALASALMLASAGCAQASSGPSTPSPNLNVSLGHTPSGSGSLSFPTSIYDPTLLNDPSLIEDQWRRNND